MKFSDCKSKVAKVDFVKQQIAQNDLWTIRALLAVYAHQTADEQRAKTTNQNNGVGFSGTDATILSDFAQKAMARGVQAMMANKNVEFSLSRIFSENQIAYMKRRMPRYAAQLVRHVDQKQVA